ncbi:MAG: glycosyltransferase 4 family protein [archaeon]
MAVETVALLTLSLLAAFATTFFLTPVIARELVKAGITGRDMHKRKRPILAEMGGLSIVFGIIVGFSFAIALTKNSNPLENLLGAFACILVIALIGIVDDIFQLPQLVKALLPILGALPLIALREGTSAVTLPLVGQVDFGIFYLLILIPLGITGAANATNILAGLNGLEAGLGIVMHSAVLAVSLLVLPSQPEAIYSAAISAIMVGSLLAFLWFNKYPAKTFPGDVGTLVIGGALGAAVILGNIERVGVLLIIPYFAELLLKAKTRFKGQSFGVLQKDGTLAAPKKIESLTHVAMKLGRLTESQIVLVLVGIEAVFGGLAILSVL